MELYDQLFNPRANQHDIEIHVEGRIRGIKDPSCIKCNPLPEEISEEFKRFWEWYKEITGAVMYTRKTVERFKEVKKQIIKERDGDFILINIEDIIRFLGS